MESAVFVFALTVASTCAGAATVAFLVADTPPDIAHDACRFFRWAYLGVAIVALVVAVSLTVA